MLHLIYVGEKEKKYAVDFTKVSEHVIQIVGDFPAKGNGFFLSRIDSEDGWDYTGFRTIYRNIEGGAQFSDDGSVYVPPVVVEPEEPGPYVPTPEEVEAMLRSNKKDKVYLSKVMLAEYLENHPLHSCAHGGVEGVYSVTSEKQSLMMSQYMTYQIAKTVDPEAKLTWNESGKSCTEWTEEEFLQLILEIKTYVYPIVSYQQTLEERINECTTQEELDRIDIDYGTIHRKGE